MIEDGVVVDTSVIIEFLKDAEQYSSIVTNIIEKNRLVTTGIILAELMQGIKKPKEEDLVIGLLTAANIIEISTDLWIKTGKISSSLRRKGINLPITDIAIAAIAIEHNFSILTLDKHFEQIPNLRFYNNI